MVKRQEKKYHTGANKYDHEKNVFPLYSLEENIELPPYVHTQFQDVCELASN